MPDSFVAIIHSPDYLFIYEGIKMLNLKFNRFFELFLTHSFVVNFYMSSISEQSFTCQTSYALLPP